MVQLQLEHFCLKTKKNPGLHLCTFVPFFFFFFPFRIFLLLPSETLSMSVKYSIIVHGGAWATPDSLRAGCVAGCERAAIAGSQVLQAGGSALDAVEAAVKILEDDPHFGAGYGSSLTAEGHVETDALIMDGSRLGLGAVGGVRGVKNPISLARAVMEKTSHTFLVGEGALKFAKEAGVPLVQHENDMVAPFALEEWESFKARTTKLGEFFGNPTLKGDTVGCVAIDQAGKIAVGTSTGGIPFKRPGRVGDSPLIGCGGYADAFSGTSTTGHGESIMRVLLAKEVASFIDAGLAPSEACRRGLDIMKKKVNGSAGAISIDRNGRVGLAFNTPRMSYAFIEHGKPLVSGIDPADLKGSKL